MLNDAQRKLVEDNQKLVYWVIARKFPWLTQDEDLQSVGTIGLCKAAEYFDESKGYNFSTYAHRIILNEIIGQLRTETKIHQREMDGHVFVDVGDNAGGKISIFETVPDDRNYYELFEISEDLQHAIEKVPKEWMNVVDGFLAGKSLRQMGKETKRSKQAVHNKLHRAMRILERELKGYD